MDERANDETQPHAGFGHSGEQRASGARPNANAEGISADQDAGAADADPEDMSVRDKVPDPGSYQSNHGTTGMGGDDERGDPDDAKVTGRSRG